MWLRSMLCIALLASLDIVPVQAGPRQQGPGPSGTAASPPPLTQSLDALAELVKRVPNLSLSVNFAEFRVRMVVSKLQQLAKQWPAQSPADYRATLEQEVRALAQAIKASEPEQLQAVLEALADDLEVKLEHCDRSGGKLGGSVAVTVRTVRGEQESRNWQVFYLPKVFEAVGGVAADRFPQLSSPTVETLVPGRYVMWVRDSTGALTSEKSLVKVGEGKKDLLLDLVVPQQSPR